MGHALAPDHELFDYWRDVCAGVLCASRTVGALSARVTVLDGLDGLDAGGVDGDVAVWVARGGDVRAATGEALALLQAWLADERLARVRLVIATRGAVAAAEGDVPDPALAAVWGARPVGFLRRRGHRGEATGSCCFSSIASPPASATLISF